jgi:hypothetical protein
VGKRRTEYLERVAYGKKMISGQMVRQQFGPVIRLGWRPGVRQQAGPAILESL